MEQLRAQSIINNLGVASRANRERVANYFKSGSSQFQLLLAVFDTNFKNNYKAAWVLEILCERELEIVSQNIYNFSPKLRLMTHHSGIRALSKIARWVAIDYYKNYKNHNLYIHDIKYITPIVETGFDWMIGPYHTASKAYTMDTLYYIGKVKLKEFEWVHAALKEIILKQINGNTPGFVNHGNKLLEKLK